MSIHTAKTRIMLMMTRDPIVAHKQLKPRMSFPDFSCKSYIIYTQDKKITHSAVSIVKSLYAPWRRYTKFCSQDDPANPKCNGCSQNESRELFNLFERLKKSFKDHELDVSFPIWRGYIPNESVRPNHHLVIITKSRKMTSTTTDCSIKSPNHHPTKVAYSSSDSERQRQYSQKELETYTITTATTYYQQYLEKIKPKTTIVKH